MKLNRIVCLTTLTLAVIGCKVDSSYDFSELDTTMTVLKGAEFPVPSVQLKLKDVYPLDDFDYVQVDGAGNYLIRFDCDPIEVSVEFPESPAFDGDRIPIDFDPVVYRFDGVPELLSGHDPSVLVDLSEMVVTMAVNSTAKIFLERRNDKVFVFISYMFLNCVFAKIHIKCFLPSKKERLFFNERVFYELKRFVVFHGLHREMFTPMVNRERIKPIG